MTTRKGYRRPAPKPKTPTPVYKAPIGKNSPNAIIRMASGVPAPKKRPMRKGRGAGLFR
jgi:hypothetical protein